MANVVIMPKQGQSVESCIISEFKKHVGDTVKAGDVLFGYETDKATFEEESQFEGTVLACFFNDGDEVPVLTNVMVIGAPGESFEEFAPALNAAGTAPETVSPDGSTPPRASHAVPPLNVPRVAVVSETAPSAINAGATINGQSPLNTASNGATDYIGTGAVSPRARRLAAEKGVNTDLVAGSGPGGRIIERDVLAAAAAQGHLSGLARAKMAEGGFASPGAGSGPAGTVKGSDLKVWKASHSDIPGEGVEFDTVKMSNMRKLIAKSMYNSLQNSAQLTHMIGADATRVQALRKKAKKALEEGRLDVNITINDFVCLAVIKALQAFPSVNSHCLGDAMRIFKCVNLGLAVDTERGLMVPAVPHADGLGIIELSKALKKVAEDAKKGSINPDLLSPEAASFTVSNLGGFGVEWFTPIINVPQSAILGVGTIVPRPKAIDGEYKIVPYMGLSLTYDHRAIDGGEATRFLKEVATQIETLDIEL